MYFFIKTRNPRPTFHLDMTADERAIMAKHVAYWSEQAALGVAIVFGPVMDPQGVYGVGVDQVQDERKCVACSNTTPPTGCSRYDDVWPMPRAVVGTRRV